MAWDVKAFMDEYSKGECDNVRCRNRKNALEEQGRELRDAQTALRNIMMRAKQDAPNSQVARVIYQMVADYNLGHRETATSTPLVETLHRPDEL